MPQLSTRVTYILVMLGLRAWLYTPSNLSFPLRFGGRYKMYALNKTHFKLGANIYW